VATGRLRRSPSAPLGPETGYGLRPSPLPGPSKKADNSCATEPDKSKDSRHIALAALICSIIWFYNYSVVNNLDGKSFFI
jgi:hypothetical protein